jgi:hypothetical protein
MPIARLPVPWHGGAPGPTVGMLDEAAASGDVAAWAERKFAAGERLVGFGHRVFRLGDPRAAILRTALERLSATLGPATWRLAFAAEVERAVGAAFARLKPGREPLQPNIEINAALRSGCRATRSPRFSRWRGLPGGSPMRWNNNERAGWSGRPRPMSGHGRRGRQTHGPRGLCRYSSAQW